MEEQWKIITEATNYEISNLGNVRNSITGKLLKGRLSKSGYLQVSIKLINTNNFTNKYIHRLVGIYWIENPEHKREINHKDGNKTNNCVDNLEWVTCSENNMHAINTGLRTYDNRMIKINQYKGDKLIATYKSMHEAKRMTNISLGNIGSVINGIRKTAGGYVWKKA